MEVSEETAISVQCDGQRFYFCSEGCRRKFLEDRSCKRPTGPFDLIIIGGGPAGLTAATFAATLKMKAFLIARDLGGQAVDSTKIENYMGFDFITGPELVSRFQNQLLHSHFVDHLMDEVTRIIPEKDAFHVVTRGEDTFLTNAVLVTTGMTRKKLYIPGEEEFQRRGVFYGNIPDFSFVEGEEVAVIGGGNSALQIVENLRTLARRIHLVSTSKLKADPAIIERVKVFPNLTVYEGYRTLQFAGENSLTTVEIEKMSGGKRLCLSVQGVFVAIGHEPNSALVADLVALNEKEEIVIRPDCATSRPGIFAAGDVTDAFGKRIIIASGEGAKAALAAKAYLLKKAGAEAIR
nr:FAD-dependent oxidoreductase [Syntrophotalea acetylenivorans]